LIDDTLLATMPYMRQEASHVVVDPLQCLELHLQRCICGQRSWLAEISVQQSLFLAIDAIDSIALESRPVLLVDAISRTQFML
jgi:hypothetical protein